MAKEFFILVVVLLILYVLVLYSPMATARSGILAAGSLMSHRGRPRPPSSRFSMFGAPSVSFSPQVVERVYNADTGAIIGRDAVIRINDAAAR